jgi:hypothetical protein
MVVSAMIIVFWDVESCSLLDTEQRYRGNTEYQDVGLLKVKLTLEQAMKAQMGSRSIALFVL